jgi:hypothetical protein
MRHIPLPGPEKEHLSEHDVLRIVRGMSRLERKLFRHLDGMELLRYLKKGGVVEGNRHQEPDLVARLWRGEAPDASDMVRVRMRLRVLQNRLNKSLAKGGCALRVWRPEPGQLLLGNLGRRTHEEKITEDAEKHVKETLRMFGSSEEEIRQQSQDSSLPVQKGPSKLQLAIDFLRAKLSDRPVEVNVIKALAIHKNIKRSTLRRARESLKVVCGRRGFGPESRCVISLPR